MVRVEAALRALPPGVAAVQLRAKALGGRALYEAAAALAEITAQLNAALVVNDRADVALAVGAQGVHLPVAGLPVRAARQGLGPRLAIGASTHSAKEAQAAWEGGADYITFGPVYSTASKLRYGPPLGTDALAAVLDAARGPVFALGGLNPERAAVCTALGARVACIGAVLGQADPAAAALGLWARCTGRRR